jgi:hypothetical protein
VVEGVQQGKHPFRVFLSPPLSLPKRRCLLVYLVFWIVQILVVLEVVEADADLDDQYW